MLKIDLITNSFAKSIESTSLTNFSKLINFIFEVNILAIISIIIIIYLFTKSKRKEGIFFGSVFILTSGIVLLLKETIQRARPLNALIEAASFSIPSGHTTISLVFLGLVTYIFTKDKSRKEKLTAYYLTTSIVIIIGLTRLYLRVHWLTDIITSFILGSLILFLSIKIFNKYK